MEFSQAALSDIFTAPQSSTVVEQTTMAKLELWSLPVVQTLFARSPPAPLSPKGIWRQDLTAQINQLSANVNIRAGKYSTRQGD